MATCRECERTLKPFEVPRGTCQPCAAKSVQSLVKSRHTPKAGIFDLDGGGPSLNDLLEPVQEEEKVRDFETGWATFVRENGDVTALNLMQVWADNHPMLVIRLGEELNLFRFKKIPSVGYKEILFNAGVHYVLLSNGPLVRSDRRDLGPTVKDVTEMAQRELLKIKDPECWSPGSFRKQNVLVFTLSQPGIVSNPQRLLEHLESMQDMR